MVRKFLVHHQCVVCVFVFLYFSLALKIIFWSMNAVLNEIKKVMENDENGDEREAEK